MRAHEALEILAHLPPNTPGGSEQPFSDKRFSKFWCPFHKGRKVWLQVYQPHPGAVAFTCSEACLPHSWIYDLLHARFLRRGYDPFYFQVVVTRITTVRTMATLGKVADVSGGIGETAVAVPFQSKSVWALHSEDIKKWKSVAEHQTCE